MMIGDDVAVLGVDDDPGSGTLELPLARLGVRRNVEKLPEERIIHQRIALPGLFLDRAARGNVDH